MARKPQPGGDRNAWGAILNEYFDVAHNTDGTIKPAGVQTAVATEVETALSVQLHPAVVEELSLNTTVADAAAAAVDAEPRVSQLVTDMTTAQGDIYDLTADNILARGRTFDVKAYGAKGDGVTDDTAAIQAAANAMPSTGGSGGGTLMLSAGPYVVTDTITIAQHGARVDSAGGFTAMLVPSANFPANKPVLDFAITNSVFRGPQIKNIRIYLHGSNASGIRMGSPYDNAYMENVFIDGIGGTNYGIKIETESGASAPVSQTFTAINCSTWGRSGATGVGWHLENLQEATFLNCKGGLVNGGGTAFRVAGGRSIAFYNCSGSACDIGWHIMNSVNPVRNILIDMPLFENTTRPLVIAGSSGNNVGAVKMAFPRIQTFAGDSTINYVDGANLDMRNLPLTIGTGANFTSVITGDRSLITDNGAYTQIEETRNATNGRRGISPGLNLFSPSNPEIRFEVAGRAGFHRDIWLATQAADSGFEHRFHNGTSEVTTHKIDANGSTQRWSVLNAGTAVETLKISNAPTSNKTAMYLLTNRGGTVSMQQVEVGAADSGGTGYRVLRVPN